MTTPRNEEDTTGFYTEISERYDWIFSEWDDVTRRYADQLAPLLAQHRVGTVLDCACGTGLQAVVDQPAQFDFYDGGGLDFAALGAAQIDTRGNVNVSRYGTKLRGVGGFVNITQTAKRVVFCGTFTSGGLEINVDDRGLTIRREGGMRKFVDAVDQISFSADRARNVGQEVWYVTERAVFRLAQDGLELIEVAPGVDVQEQVLNRMAFAPIIQEVRPMAQHLFRVPA